MAAGAVHTNPAEYEDANQFLKLWGQQERLYGPSRYPSSSAFVPKARGLDCDVGVAMAEVVGSVVSQLHEEEREVVRDYYVPGSEGMTCSVRAICDRRAKNHKQINKILDRCIGRVAQAFQFYFAYDN